MMGFVLIGLMIVAFALWAILRELEKIRKLIEKEKHESEDEEQRPPV